MVNSAPIITAAVFLASSAPALADASCVNLYNSLNGRAPAISFSNPNPPRFWSRWHRARVINSPQVMESIDATTQRDEPENRYQVSGPIRLTGKFTKFDHGTTQTVSLRFYSASKVKIDLTEEGGVVSLTVDPVCREQTMFIPVSYNVASRGAVSDVHMIE